MKLAPLNAPPLTQEEIDAMAFTPHGMTDFDCRCLVAYMMGYLRMSPDIEATRQAFFKQIRANQEAK